MTTEVYLTRSGHPPNRQAPQVRHDRHDRQSRHEAASVTANQLDMLYACFYASSMTKMIQIRNVPDRVHATLKARAALAGQPLTDYLLAELRRVAELPTEVELAERLLGREQARLRTAPAAAVRAERDRR